jgi:L-methionine (R)-S-oxide reductase
MPYIPLAGFYIQSALFPRPKTIVKQTSDSSSDFRHLLLGPFCGKPACQLINVEPLKAKGVCADAFMKREVILVPDVEAYPGHIACDAETKSEIVCPLIARVSDHETMTVGVLDLDCLAPAGFSEEDRVGLEKIAQLVAGACDW